MRRLAQAGAITTIGVAASAILGWARVKGLAVELGVADFGIYGQVWSLVLYVGGFSALGIGVAATRIVAVERERQDAHAVMVAVRATLLLSTSFGILLGLVTVALSPVLAPLLIDSDQLWIIALAGLSVPFVALHAPLEHVLQGFEDAKGQATSYVIYGLVFSLSAVGGAAAAGVTGAVAGLGVGNVVLAILYLIRTRKVSQPLRDRLKGPFSEPESRRLGTVARTLLRVGAASLAVTVVFAFADLAVRTTILHSSGEAQAGVWYALTIISVQLVGAFAGAMSFLTAPLAARAAANPEPTSASHVVDNSWRLTLVVVIPVIALIVALREQVVPILLSHEFSEASTYMPAQAVGDVLRSLAWAAGVVLVPLGLTRAWLAIGIVASAAYGVIGSLAAARWGIDGAVAGWVVMWAISFLATVLVLVRRHAWRPSTRAVRGTLMAIPLIGAAAALPVVPAAVTVAILSICLLGATLSRGELNAGWRAMLKFAGRAPGRQSPPA